MNRITNQLIHKGYLKTDVIIEAFAEIPRAEFVPSRLRAAAESDIPIPLGHGFMLPAVSTVAFMLELLAPQKGQRVLVAGHGGGWVSALLSYIVGRSGHVTSVGRSEALHREALRQMAKFRFIERDHIVDTYLSVECEQFVPEYDYDRICVLDDFFLRCDMHERLVTHGGMVAPVHNVITLFKKTTDTAPCEEEPFAGMPFLPLD